MRANGLRAQWIVPMAVLGGIALSVFVLLYLLDFYLTGSSSSGASTTPLGRYFQFDPESITDAVSSLAAMIAAVLGIVITVVSIVVQLSAGRYTRVATMFFKDSSARDVRRRAGISISKCRHNTDKQNVSAIN